MVLLFLSKQFYWIVLKLLCML